VLDPDRAAQRQAQQVRWASPTAPQAFRETLDQKPTWGFLFFPSPGMAGPQVVRSFLSSVLSDQG